MDYIADTKTRIRTAAAFEILGVLVMAAAVAILAYDCLTWLKTGAWSSTSLFVIGKYAGWNYPYLEWRGAQKIFGTVMEFPLWLLLAVCGVGIMSIALPAKNSAQEFLSILKNRHE